MDITIVKDSTFKIKGKSGFALTDPNGLTIESLDGSSSKVFKTAGEYEVSGISVVGIKTEEGNVFVYEVDGLRICHLGNITKKLSDNKVSTIGDIDVLFVPLGSESIELIQQIQSYYVIPYRYKSQEELDSFIKEAGFGVSNLTKFSLKKDQIIEDSTAQVVVLS